MSIRSARRRTLASVVVTVLGAALLTYGGIHLHHPAPRQTARAFGTVLPTPGPTPAPAAAASTPPPRTVNGDGVPLRVRITRLKIDAPVVPVLSAGGAIDVPIAPTTLGWWVGGAVPGSLVGSTVIVGHVDSAVRGTGALFHLDQVHAGDTVDVDVTGGRTQRYRVTALRTVRKTTGLDSSELGSAGPARLTLITCGGPFDERTKSYDDNVVAFAEPVSG